METSVSLVAEIPDSLHKELQEFLDTQTDWDFDQLLTAAISLFLRQNSHDVKKMNYLSSSRNLPIQTFTLQAGKEF